MFCEEDETFTVLLVLHIVSIGSQSEKKRDGLDSLPATSTEKQFHLITSVYWCEDGWYKMCTLAVKAMLLMPKTSRGSRFTKERFMGRHNKM